MIVETINSPYQPHRRPAQAVHIALPEQPTSSTFRSPRARGGFLQLATLNPSGRLIVLKWTQHQYLARRQVKREGAAPPEPRESTLPLPYADETHSKPASPLPLHFIDQSGVFEW